MSQDIFGQFVSDHVPQEPLKQVWRWDQGLEDVAVGVSMPGRWVLRFCCLRVLFGLWLLDPFAKRVGMNPVGLKRSCQMFEG